MVDSAQATSPSYKIESVRRAEPKPEFEGSSWYDYVISYDGKDNIHGFRRGDREAVTTALEEIVAHLNERHAGRFHKTGRVHLVLTPRNKT